MADGSITIGIAGAGKAQGELSKVAGGYRAIGSAAKEAARSADKVHGSGLSGAAGRAERTTRAIGKAFRGTALGGVSKMGGDAIEAAAVLGPWGLALAASSIAVDRWTKSLELSTQSSIRKMEADDKAADMADKWNKSQGDKAWGSFEKMSPEERARLVMEGGSKGKAIQAAMSTEDAMKKADEANMYARLEQQARERRGAIINPLAATVADEGKEALRELAKQMKRAEDENFLTRAKNWWVSGESEGQKASRMADELMHAAESMRKAGDSVRMQVDRDAKAGGLP